MSKPLVRSEPKLFHWPLRGCVRSVPWDKGSIAAVHLVLQLSAFGATADLYRRVVLSYAVCAGLVCALCVSCSTAAVVWIPGVYAIVVADFVQLGSNNPGHQRGIGGTYVLAQGRMH